jgi:hypothetical protein
MLVVVTAHHDPGDGSFQLGIERQEHGAIASLLPPLVVIEGCMDPKIARKW